MLITFVSLSAKTRKRHFPQSIFSDRGIEYRIRISAVIFLKNTVHRYWNSNRRSTNTIEISEREKSHLRNALIGVVNERNHTIAEQISLVIAKIARFDFPLKWPNLFETLLGQYGRSPIHTDRAVMILQRVLKVLSSKRLPSAKRVFAQIQEKLLSTILERWHSIMNEFIIRLKRRVAERGNENNNITHQNQPSILILGCTCVNLCKCIHRLVIHGSSSVRSVGDFNLSTYSLIIIIYIRKRVIHLYNSNKSNTGTQKSFDGTIFLHSFRERFDGDIDEVRTF